MSDIRVLVVDDHAILRDGIRSLLERQPGIEVAGEAANGLEALQQAALLMPDVVLMDIAMPVMDGLEATRRLRDAYPGIKVLILTQHDSREYVAPLLQAGAAGYVLKRSGGREVVAALRQVQEQGAYIEPALLRQALAEPSPQAASTSAPGEKLTERERDILRLVVDGHSNKEIARALSISPKTVSVHRTNIMSKLGVQNSADLVRFALQHRLVELGD